VLTLCFGSIFLIFIWLRNFLWWRQR
jgi:hypothetical protein